MPSYDDLLHQFSDLLTESQYWAPDRMRDYQREQLEQLLRHARAYSQFYERRLDAVFRTGGAINWDRWLEIPILTRQDLADHREAMLTTQWPVGHGSAGEYTTSGSSGVAVTIRANGIASLASRAATYRAYDWHNIDFTKTLCSVLRTTDKTVATWPAGRGTGPWGPSWAYGTSAGRRMEISFLETYPHMLDFLKRTESEYLVTAPTIAHALAMEAVRLDSGIRLERIFTHGAAPTDAGLEAYRTAFGAGILPLYSSKEAGTIAHACSSGPHYHVHAENVLLEVIGDDGNPCSPGETGRAVVTPFLSTYQPIIRYDLGDLITAGAPCGCGRNLPVLQEIAGRVSHVFRFPDGSTTYRRIPQSMRPQLKAGRWQIAQVAPLRIELRYEPLDWNSIGDEDGVVEVMKSLYPAEVEIVVRRVEQVNLTEAGKLIEYVYEVDR